MKLKRYLLYIADASARWAECMGYTSCLIDFCVSYTYMFPQVWCLLDVAIGAPLS